MKNFLKYTLLFTLWLTPCLQADEEDPVSDICFSADSSDTFIDVVESLTKMCYDDGYIVKSESPEKLCLSIEVYPNYYLVRASKKAPSIRNYATQVTAEQKNDITYILTTLAKSSLTNLATVKSSLKKAGDRIDPIYPFRFLGVVFTDDTLKASVSAIRSRSWVWDQFFDGLHRSLKEESQRNNLTETQVNEFAALTQIPAATIQSMVNNQRWKELINFLIDTVPRAGNPNFYDM